MARLATCPDCGKAVSKKAAACPSCGRPMRRAKGATGCVPGCLAIILIGGFLVFLVVVSSGPRRPVETTPPRPQAAKPGRPEGFRPADRPAADGLPAYRLADYINLLAGGTHGEAVVPSLSPSSPVAELESAARGIAAKEGLDNLDLFSTEDARRASSSEIYSKAHPGARDAGYLGRIERGAFHPPSP